MLENAFVTRTPAYPEFVLARNADNTGFAISDDYPLRADGSNGGLLSSTVMTRL